MPVRRDYARRNSLRGSTARPARTRQSRYAPVSKIWKKRPTARVQQRQIARVTRLAIANRARFRKCYTDYQWTPTASTEEGGYSWTLVPGTWEVQRLTNFDQWRPVLRQNINVQQSNHTYVHRVSVDLRFELSTGFAGVNVFIVRPRFSGSGRDFFSAPPSTSQADYVQNDVNPGFNVVLNSDKLKVMSSRYFTMRDAPKVAPAVADFLPGDPTYVTKRFQVNLSPHMKVVQRATLNPPDPNTPPTWLSKGFETLPYYDQYYMMVLPAFDTSTTRVAGYMNVISTCINTL